MRKLLFLLFPVLAVAQPISTFIAQPDCMIPFRFTAATTSPNLDNRFQGCVNWTITYASSGFSVVSLSLQDAPDSSGAPGSWADWQGTVITGINPNTATTSAYTQVSGYYPWIRVNLATATGTGFVNGTAYGWRASATSTHVPTLIVDGTLSVGTTILEADGQAWVNVKAKGAKGDNSTDDTTAIQAAITTACTGSKVVWFPAAMYRTTSTLNVTCSDLTLQGSGMLSSTIRLDSATAIAVTVTGPLSGFHMADLQIQSYLASNNTRTAGSSVYLLNTGNATLERLYFRNGWDSIVLDGASTTLLRYVVVDGPTASVASGGLNRALLLNNTAVSTTLEGFYPNCQGSSCGPAMQIDTGTDTVDIHHFEQVGNFSFGIQVTNTGGAHDPRWVHMYDVHSEPQQTTGIGVEISKCYDCELIAPYLKGGKNGLHVTGTAHQTLVNGGVILVTQQYGALIETSGIDTTIIGLKIDSASQTSNNVYSGITVACPVTHFMLKDIRSGNLNMLGTESAFQKWGVELTAGACDYYEIEGDFLNNVSGTITDGGTGVHKHVADLAGASDLLSGNFSLLQGYALQSTGGVAPTLTAGCNGAGSSVTAGSTNNRGQFTTQSGAATTCTLTFSAAGTWNQAPVCIFTDANASVTPRAFSAGAVGTSTAVVDFASGTSLVVNYMCM